VGVIETSIDTSTLRRAVPDAVLSICERLNRQGHAAWVVGGCVRDQLLNILHPYEKQREPGDWDIATSALPQVVQKLFPKVIPTGLEHGTVTVVLDKVPYEVTTFRAEAGYVDGRRPGQVMFLDDIAADLGRRDFTVNAIAYDPIADKLADPYDGIADLKAGVIRAVGKPAERFAEDGLRVLRAARFVSALEFNLDEATAEAIRPSLGSYRKVSSERIRDEWFKAFKSRRPSLAFDVMARHGLLEATVPELTLPVDTDAWRQVLTWMDSCPPFATPLGIRFIEVRLAALLLPLVRPQESAPFVRYDARVVDEIAVRLKLSNQERARVVALLTFHRLPPSATSDAELRRWLRTVTPELVRDLFALAAAKPNTSPEEDFDLVHLQDKVDRILGAGPALYVKDLAVDGKVLMSELGLKPGKHLGELLGQLLEAVTDEPGLNTREALLLAAREVVGI
jgi:tRNA nucleotidyltransferase (CCA-adding enzyme)